MKSTWFKNPSHYAFAKILRGADYGTSLGEIFSDFLACAASTLAQAATKLATGGVDGDVEASYLETIRKREGYAKAFPEAMGALILGLEKERSDFLGDVQAALGMNDVAFRGQCFTPPALCEAMAEMSLGEASPGDFPNRQVLVNEPACGGGAAILAIQKVLERRSFFPWNYYVVAQDIDLRCFHMTFIQLSLCGVPATVHWANTLTVEVWRSWTTVAGVLHPMKRRAEPTKAFRTRTRKN